MLGVQVEVFHPKKETRDPRDLHLDPLSRRWITSVVI